ncbi:MAG: phosphatase PAP2 family protein [Bacteroidetes bacterium]|nr:phosphatase PAP2 family protein [Bacteroidota bacterium]MBU1114154.1 phosphatase PAP2 family protein [Bacteroidota bacterium]MBU1796831.1 phosphatase PAP2 family protein [Bacteroidota bacterium]
MLILLKYKLLLFILLIPNFLFSQNNYNFTQFGNEAGDYYSAPFHWDKNDFLTLGIIAAGTLTAMQFDDSIKNEFAKINSDKNNWLMEAGRYWGEVAPSIALSGILLIHGISTNDETTKKIGFEIGQALIYSVSVTSGLKIIIGRARPYTENNSTTFSPFSFKNDNLSLPSGHTTVAFSLSTVLASNTSNDGLKILAFIPAILTATSRIYQNYHWTSDVLLGAAIGYFTGKYVTDLHKRNELIPTITNTPLISFSLSF